MPTKPPPRRRQPIGEPVDKETVERESMTIESEVVEPTPLESGVTVTSKEFTVGHLNRDNCPWPPDLNGEWIDAAGKLFRLAVLQQYGVFQVAIQICAKVASGSIIPKDAEVACRAYELNQILAYDPSPAALSFSSNAYRQLLPVLRTYAQTLYDVASIVSDRAEKLEGLEVSKSLAFSAGDALFNLQLTASKAGMGIAGCVAREVDPVAESCIALLDNHSLLCACGAYDTTDLFNQYHGTNSYNDVCRLLCGSERLLHHAAEQLPNDACSTDYTIQDQVLSAGLLFNAADRSLNPAVTGSSAVRPAAPALRWTAAVEMIRQTSAMPARLGRAGLTASS